MNSNHGNLSYIGFSDSCVFVDVYVQPLAKREQIVGVHDQRLKIHLKTPPIDGKANKELRHFLASIFKTSKSRIYILAGKKSKLKKLLVQHPPPDTVKKTLEPFLFSLNIINGK